MQEAHINPVEGRQSMENGGNERQPILVTGAHRSGSTWVGKMLAAHPRLAYISEPLNVWHRPGVLRVPVMHWYTYISEENEAEYLPALRETLGFRYHAWAELQSVRSIKDLLRMGRDWSTFWQGRLFLQRPLIKDPFAVFSAAWFARRLGCRVVFTVRHPAAFVSSLVRLNWPYDLSDLLDQPMLMRAWLEPFRGEMEKMLEVPGDLVGQGSLLWRMIYHAVCLLKEQHPGFVVVRHEDLSRDPVEGFRKVYADLGLSFTPRVQAIIARSSSGDNPGEGSLRRVHAVRLDSRANLENWKRRLAPEEIARVRAVAAEVGEYYYSSEDWE